MSQSCDLENVVYKTKNLFSSKTCPNDVLLHVKKNFASWPGSKDIQQIRNCHSSANANGIWTGSNESPFSSGQETLMNTFNVRQYNYLEKKIMFQFELYSPVNTLRSCWARQFT